MVHDLQEQVEDVWMRFFDLIEQEHGMGVLDHCVGQQPALVEPDVSRRRADQAGHRVTLHIFGHVEPDQLDAEKMRKLPSDLGLADTGGPREQERPDRFVFLPQP